MVEVYTNTFINYLSTEQLNKLGQNLIGQKRIFCPKEIYETIVENLNKTKQLKVFNINEFLTQFKETVTINFKTPTGKSIIIDCPLKCPIFEIKRLYCDKENLNMCPAQQRYVFAGKQLEDCRTLEDYGVQNNSTIFVVLRLRGGMFHVSSGRLGLEESRPTINIKFKFLGVDSEIEVGEDDLLENIIDKFINCLLEFSSSNNSSDFIKIFIMENPTFFLKYGDCKTILKEPCHNVWQEIKNIEKISDKKDITLLCC